MKRFFIAAMALATIVGCSKDTDDVVLLDSHNKSISITIENSSKATRGDAEHTTAATTGSQIAVANASELMIFFATSNGTILEYKKLVGTGDDHKAPGTSDPQYAYGTTTATGTSGAAIQGDYVFHNVPAAITQVAIARYENGDLEISKGSDNLSKVLALATSDINENREIDDICLYGVGTLSNEKGEKCVEYNGVTYYLYDVEVEVKPAIARLEIHSIGCKNLGVANDDTDITTFGIDKLALNSLAWGGGKTPTKYTIAAADFEDVVLHGTYKANGTTTADGLDNVEGDNIHVCPTANKVWSWNVPTSANVPSTTNPMVLKMTASAYDYDLAQTDLQLNVVGFEEGLTEFEAGNIYQMDLLFDEGDIAGQEGVCVNVTVSIVDWVVDTLTPSFGK